MKFIEEPRSFLEMMVNVERAINYAAEKAEKELYKSKSNYDWVKWYRTTKLLKAMTEIKCGID